MGSPDSAVITEPARGLKLKNERIKVAFELTIIHCGCTGNKYYGDVALLSGVTSP
jgi:hypothetical protein